MSCITLRNNKSKGLKF